MRQIPYAFYLPENPAYTIIDSAMDSVRYLIQVSDLDQHMNLVCRSIDSVPDGTLCRFRGRLIEGVGYCADSVFGAHMLVRLGRVLERSELEGIGWSFLDHVLGAGFFDDPNLPIRLYRDTEGGEMLDNLEGRSEYIEPGHIARVAHQLLGLAALDQTGSRKDRMLEVVGRTVDWSRDLERCENGWYSRRSTPDGRVFHFAPDAHSPIALGGHFPPDPIYDHSGCGSLIVQLLAAATAAGVRDASGLLQNDVDVFMSRGGFFGSTNSDTQDSEENVSYALAFQALSEAAVVLGNPAVLDFAYTHCLMPLERFELVEDINGLATKGLLYMEDSWPSACMWEIAEAAQAYLVAFLARPERVYLSKALTLLRGTAKHHHGLYGFLTEAVDWDGHSVVNRRMHGLPYADIRTTHPFLNNLHLLEPTVTYLEQIAKRLPATSGTGEAFFDFEGNQLATLPYGTQAWMQTHVTR